MRRPRVGLFVCVIAVSLVGCNPDNKILPDTMLPDGVVDDAPLPGYTELIERYNATAEHLSPTRADARVDLVWIDDKGKKKNEHGDGRFMFIKPSRVVLEVEEFGRGFWAGADGERYWFFDFLDKRIAYVGRFEDLDGKDIENLPLPVNPADLLHVLGLAPIDPSVVPDAPAVERIRGYLLVEPPGLGLRMLLDPATARPVRVDLIDELGRSTLICTLKDPIPVRPADLEEMFGGEIASRVDIFMTGREARMTLTLKKPIHSDKHIREPYFDFDKLYKALRMKELVDLDRVEIAPVE